jgi:perosamine synthetase
VIPYGLHEIDEDDIAAVVDVLRHGPIAQGELTDRFGQAVASACGARYGLAVSSGTAGLQLAARSLDLEQGDEVIMPPLTFCATANSVILAGGEVKLVDVEPHTWNIDIERIEQAVNPRTKAIFPVDFRGHPANLGEIWELAAQYGLQVVEDAAHSLGSNYVFKSEKFYCGDCQHADLAVCSFHPAKHLTTGEGGVVLCNDFTVYQRISRLSQHGLFRSKDQESKTARVGPWIYELEEVGFNFRLTEFQAALGLSQIKKLKVWKKRRREIVRFYIEKFSKLDWIQLPVESTTADSNFHIFVVLISDNPRFDRYDVFHALQKIGYAPMVHYIPLSNLSFYRSRYNLQIGDYPNAEEYYKKAITLPLFPSMSDGLVEKVATDFMDIIERLSS